MSTTMDASGADESAAGWLGEGRAARRIHRRSVTYQAASVLLGRPDQVFFERLPLVARAVAELPGGEVRTALREFCEHASTTAEPRLRAHHAEVFDPRGHGTAYLTSYGEGGARRGERVLAEIRNLYAGAGWRVEGRERPDHLAVVLDFAARGDARGGERLLLRLRPELELLHEALRACGTPYARIVDAVRMTLREHEDGVRVPSPRDGRVEERQG